MGDDAAAVSQSLAGIASEVAACRACVLYRSATRAVPGEGPVTAQLMLIGEAPGFHEDRLARPFVGAAGKLLEELLLGIGLRRDEVFITNVIKHRPPENRDPLPEEIAACRPFLDRQLALVNPRVIGLLGRFAMEQFLPGLRIGQAHGRLHRLGDRILVPLIHPAAALHRGDWRPHLQTDFQALRRALDAAEPGVEVPPKPPETRQLSLF